MLRVPDDNVGFNTGNGEKLIYSKAEPGQLLGYSLISLHIRFKSYAVTPCTSLLTLPPRVAE